ncbi:MAG: hypothetical protein U0360_04705 [Dehalococcoidia bacterium]
MLRSALTRHRILLVAFVIVVLFTGWQAARAARHAMVLHGPPRDEPIAEWMTIRRVAASYHVPPWVLQRALGLPETPDRRPLSVIAESRGEPFAQLRGELEAAIAEARASGVPFGPPPPPPPRPTTPN